MTLPTLLQRFVGLQNDRLDLMSVHVAPTSAATVNDGSGVEAARLAAAIFAAAVAFAAAALAALDSAPESVHLMAGLSSALARGFGGADLAGYGAAREDPLDAFALARAHQELIFLDFAAGCSW
jgi:hypothetical protein